MSANYYGLIEVLLTLGGLIAFATWQFTSLKRDREKLEREQREQREQAEREAAGKDSGDDRKDEGKTG